ncbi:MAG: hypothetical protein MI757_02590, partial [Pirellulales bacterium]|nr:hypothetical protein [Pirellulales bacterium]
MDWAQLRSVRELLFAWAVCFCCLSSPLADESAADEQILPLKADSLRPANVLGDSRFKHAEDLTHIVWIDGGRRLLSSARDGTVRLWDANSGQELQRFYHPGGSDVWNLRGLPGERGMLTCGGDQHVTRWD